MDIPAISRGRALAFAAAALALLLVGGLVLRGGGNAAGGAGPAETGTGTAPQLVAETAPPAELVVDVAGAVRRPGLYRLPEGSRVDDAIRRAGGPTRKALLAAVNLAAPVADGQQVLVPTAAGGSAAGGAAPGATAAPAGPVSLNSATLEQLDSLPGVGPTTAQRILDYRAAHGAFHSVDELDAVPGIGPARLQQLRELVTP